MSDTAETLAGNKRRLLALVFALALALGLASSCGAKEADKGGPAPGAGALASVDIGQLAAELRDEIDFADSLEPISEEAFHAMYGIEGDSGGVADYALYAGSGATAEEIAVMEAADEQSAQALEEAARGRVAAQKEAFANYNSGELEKLDGAVLVRKGRYVALCVSDDSEKAQGIIDSYMK